jgi:hypothetical protein
VANKVGPPGQIGADGPAPCNLPRPMEAPLETTQPRRAMIVGQLPLHRPVDCSVLPMLLLA